MPLTAAAGGGGEVIILPPPGFLLGFIKVNVNPPEAVTGGARWQVAGYTNIFNPNDLVAAMIGSYQLVFTAVAGYSTPAARWVTVAEGQTNTVSVTYMALPRTLRVERPGRGRDARRRLLVLAPGTLGREGRGRLVGRPDDLRLTLLELQQQRPMPC